jgi:hypothetical protein
VTRPTFRAQMTNSGEGWRLYVALFGSVALWPEFDWSRPEPVPTPAERQEALSSLGFEIVPGREWTWSEHSETHDDPASPAFLIAAVAVRSEEEWE